MFSQDTIKTVNANRIGYKEWTKYKSLVRFGIGVQKSFSTELGITRHKYMFNDLAGASAAYYSTIEWIPPFSSNNDNVYGLKAGYEISAGALALGLEAKYQTDFVENDFVFTPRIGLSVVGVVTLFYGYNISTNGNPFPNVGNHQFTVICNFNSGVFKNVKTRNPNP